MFPECSLNAHLLNGAPGVELAPAAVHVVLLPRTHEDTAFREHTAPFRENSASFREHLAPFREHSAPFKEHSAPFREHSAPFWDHSPAFRKHSVSLRSSIDRDSVCGFTRLYN
jgi:hypothetical protein